MTMIGLAALMIVPAIYPQRVVLGYVPGTILSYEVQTTRYGGTHGQFEVKLYRGEAMRLAARDGLMPGERACIRAVQRGELIEGMLVAMDRCFAR